MTDARDRLERLTAPRTVALGAMWNVAGRLGPLVIAVAATPFLLGALGVTRFGIFTLALSLIGMFGIFDFGFGRALTRIIATRIAAGEEHLAASSVITGIALLTTLGAIGGGVMALLANAYTVNMLELSPALRQEVLVALYILCASAPLVVVNAALWGVLSAFQRFASANLVNLPIMALYYLGPLLALAISNSLAAVMAVLVGCRLVMTFFYWRICIRAMPSLREGGISLAAVLPVLRFGGWLTISNMLWPVLLHLDRFIIAATLSAAAAAWYATPFDLIVRFSIIPIAIMQTAFPAMTTSYQAAPAKAARLFRFSTTAIMVILLPAALVVVCYAHPLLRIWLGTEFADHAAGVLVLLGVGVVFMCADTVPVAYLDGIGRPDLNALLDAGILVLYVPALFVMIHVLGIEGAALAWMLRVIAAYAARVGMAARLQSALLVEVRRVGPALGGCLLVLVIGAMPVPYGGWLVLPCLMLAAGTIWRRALLPAERSYLVTRALAFLPARQP